MASWDVLLFRKFHIGHLKAELVVLHIFLMLNIYGWDVQVFDVVYSGSSTCPQSISCSELQYTTGCIP
jgi:hypothetical protein